MMATFVGRIEPYEKNVRRVKRPTILLEILFPTIWEEKSEQEVFWEKG